MKEYKGNAEAKIIEIKEQIELILRSIERKQMNEYILIERLKTLHKDLEDSLFLLSLV